LNHQVFCIICNLFAGQEETQPKKSFLAVPSVQAPSQAQLALDATSESTQGRNGSAMQRILWKK
jgi:hypothetical protein